MIRSTELGRLPGQPREVVTWRSITSAPIALLPLDCRRILMVLQGTKTARQEMKQAAAKRLTIKTITEVYARVPPQYLTAVTIVHTIH